MLAVFVCATASNALRDYASCVIYGQVIILVVVIATVVVFVLVAVVLLIWLVFATACVC